MTPLSPPPDNPSPHAGIPLQETPPGSRVRILSFGRLPPERIDYLMAYGCAPGREAWVLQQAPATVLQLEGTELALEEDLARQILVTIVAAPKRRRRRWRWRVGRRRGRRRR